MAAKTKKRKPTVAQSIQEMMDAGWTVRFARCRTQGLTVNILLHNQTNNR